MNADKGKAEASDMYLQTLLSNTHFKPQTMLRPQTTLENQKLERLYFGRQNLICFPPSNVNFRLRADTKTDKQQRCLLDNLWIAYNKDPKDNSYFVSVLNALSYYFTEKNEDKKFKFYVVIKGKTPGVFQTWIEVIDAIKDQPTPLFKGFNEINEALDYARGNLGPNFYITPALRHNTANIPQYKVQKDTDKIIFCDHCSTMEEAFKRLNGENDKLRLENARMIEHIGLLQEKIKMLHQESVQTSSPSLKMDETGVHSPMNVERSTIPDRGIASPAQTVAGKDLSNPLMADTLPKSVRILPPSFKIKDEETSDNNQETIKGGTYLRRKKKETKRIQKIIHDTLKKFLETQTKEVILENPKIEQISKSSDSEGEGEYYDPTIDQFAQDPNEDNDSGMSFDSVALHNLET